MRGSFSAVIPWTGPGGGGGGALFAALVCQFCQWVGILLRPSMTDCTGVYGLICGYEMSATFCMLTWTATGVCYLESHSSVPKTGPPENSLPLAPCCRGLFQSIQIPRIPMWVDNTVPLMLIWTLPVTRACSVHWTSPFVTGGFGV